MRMRKKKNGEKRLLNLSALTLDSECGYEEIKNAFETDRPLRLEIGCGKGDFICGISSSENEYNYIALEKIGDVIMAAVEKYAVSRSLGNLAPNGGWLAPDGEVYDGKAYGIPVGERGNVRFVLGEAMEILSHLPDTSVESIYTNFSDPWPKKGYAARRLTHPKFLAEYERILIPGGMLKLKTDNDGLFEFSLESIKSSALEIADFTWDLDSDEKFFSNNIETEYERNFKNRGVKIKALRAVKNK